MALLDQDRNLIVFRIVYDGPPEAGKTTSLRALAGSLGRELYTPAEENGRTLFFDWMDYTAGRFEGREIRCQIVTVPGQAELAARRQLLLAGADVVVFVADSTRPRIADTVERLRELPHLLPSDPPVGVILQANKRDLSAAVPMNELRQLVHEVAKNVAVVESVANDGTGIRETFVFAVRLALDRAREQIRRQTLQSGAPPIDTGEALFDAMTAVDRPAKPVAVTPMAPLIEQVLAENEDKDVSLFAPWCYPTHSIRADNGPWPPSPSAPSGAIWPPVEGRVILHEASSAGMVIHRLQNGAWAAGIGNGWRSFSSGEAVFADLEEGREMLIRLARLHVASSKVLSPSRCIVLADTGQGTWRLWQIVRAEKSLRDYLDDITRCSVELAAARILEVATLLCEVNARMQDQPCQVPCSLDTVGRSELGAVYIGLVPMEDGSWMAPEQAGEHILSELESVFHGALFERRSEVMAAMVRAQRRPLYGGGLLDDLLGRLTEAST